MSINHTWSQIYALVKMHSWQLFILMNNKKKKTKPLQILIVFIESIFLFNYISATILRLKLCFAKYLQDQ